MGLAAYEIIGSDAEWRVRHDGKGRELSMMNQPNV
jgi:hypothetical protein